MADIRKREGKKGTTYQVRFPSKSTKSGYAFRTFDTLKEARDFVESGQARKGSGARHSEIRTVEQAIEKWLDVCEKEGRRGRDPVTPFTLKTYKYRATIMKAYPWSKELNELGAPDVVEFRSWLIRHHSRDLARKVLSSLHSMILEMVTRGILDHDIAVGVYIGKSSRYEEPVQIPSERDVQSLLEAADRLSNSKNAQISRSWERYRPMLYLAIDSGMRPQEYIVVPGFSLRDNGIMVDRALERGSNKISVTKTPAGRRFIDLSPETYDMVAHYRDKHAIENADDLIFPTATGGCQSIDNWRKRGFGAACREAGLIDEIQKDGEAVERPRYRPYDLRHFYASMLIERRVSLKRVQTIMGHRDIQTTLNVYGHVIERVESEAEKHTGLVASFSQNPCGKSVAQDHQLIDL
ncbi:MAG: tyrosine-type recombinase/integrase [Hyphomonas sp.]|nr:tyrosine-type recombinase/integrase [Hyphomonas sp.]